MKSSLLIFTLFCQVVFAQNLTAIKINDFPARYDEFVGTDEYDVPYFIKNNVLIKKTDEQTFEYKNLTLRLPALWLRRGDL